MMETPAEEESLSPEEMRLKLYQTFKSRGLLDTLKTRLRKQLILDLQQKPSAVPRPDSLLLTACNSLIADHLRGCGYEYTLSVFCPETGLAGHKAWSTTELLQITGLSRDSDLYKALVRKTQTGSGFLMTLLGEMTELNRGERHDAATQTCSVSAHQDSLAEKMQCIDEQYATLRGRGEHSTSLQEKISLIRKEMQEQADAELKVQLQHLRNVELVKVKHEEKEEAQKEIQALRDQLEKTYQQKAEALMSREKNAIDRLHTQQQLEEKQLYDQRQTLLREMEMFRAREQDLRKKMENFGTVRELQQQKLQAEEDDLRKRKVSLQTSEQQFHLRLQNELTKYQLELKQDYESRTQELRASEKRVEEESARLQKESLRVEEHQRSLREVKRLQGELQSLVTLKQRLTEDLQQQKIHNQQLMTELMDLQLKFQMMEETHRLEQNECETQMKLLHTQFQKEMQVCVRLKDKLQECEERRRSTDTHTPLKLSQKDAALLRRHWDPSAAVGALRGPQHTWPQEHDSDLIRELEQEMEKLKEAFRSHQDRDRVPLQPQPDHLLTTARVPPAHPPPDHLTLINHSARVPPAHPPPDHLTLINHSARVPPAHPPPDHLTLINHSARVPPAHPLPDHLTHTNSTAKVPLFRRGPDHLDFTHTEARVSPDHLTSINPTAQVGLFTTARIPPSFLPPDHLSSPQPRRLSSTPLRTHEGPKTTFDPEEAGLTFAGMSRERAISPIPFQDADVDPPSHGRVVTPPPEKISLLDLTDLRSGSHVTSAAPDDPKGGFAQGSDGSEGEDEAFGGAQDVWTGAAVSSRGVRNGDRVDADGSKNAEGSKGGSMRGLQEPNGALAGSGESEGPVSVSNGARGSPTVSGKGSDEGSEGFKEDSRARGASVGDGDGSDGGSKGGLEDAGGVDALQKYMRMLTQEQSHACSENHSADELLSGHDDHGSIDVMSHEEQDDNFW